MKLRKAIKKLVAIGTGVTMLGATVLSATAASTNLADYPSQFVKDGKFDGLMVVGASAATADVLGVVDIATSLQYNVKEDVVVKVGSGGSQVSLSGDVVEIGQPNDLLEIGERIGDVRETLTEFDLQALASGRVSTNSGSTEYNQYLRFEDTSGSGGANTIPAGYTRFDEDEYDDVGDYLYFKDGDTIFEYHIEFEEGFESSLETSAGAESLCTTSGTLNLDDLEDETLNILGETFSVVDTSVTVSGGAAVTLELLGGDIIDTLEEQETKTYTIDGKDYEVTVLIIADSDSNGNTAVKFQVNGEVTDELEDNGDTDILSDGTEIGVREILANEGTEAGGSDIVEFYLGANKVELTDNNYLDTAFDASGVSISEESIEDAEIKIQGSCTTDTFEVTNIKYRLEADAERGDVYMKAGEGIRQYLDEPEGMLGRTWDIKYEGLMDTGVSMIEFDANGDDAYTLRFTNREGIDYVVPFLDNSDDASLGFKFGNDEDDLIWMEASIGNGSGVVSGTTGQLSPANYIVNEDDYFVLTDDNDETGYTHILSFESIDDTNNQLVFTDLGTGQREVTYSGNETCGLLESGSAANCSAGQVASGDLVVGGNTFKVWVMRNDAIDLYLDNYSVGGYDAEDLTATPTGDTAASTFSLAVDVDGDGDLGSGGSDAGVAYIIVNGGGILNLGTNLCPGYNTSAVGSHNRSCFDSYKGADTAGLGDFKVVLSTVGSEFDEDYGYENVTINFKQTSNREVDVDVNSQNNIVQQGTYSYNLSMKSLSDVDVKKGMTRYGALIEITDNAGDNEADDLKIEYPLSQRGAQVYVTAGSTKKSSSSTSAGQLTTTTLERIQVGASVLDTDVGNIQANNIIVVGGPCVNTVAAELMGNPSDCTAGFSEGKGIVKMMENGNKVAMLVAGYSAQDTTRAARVIANYQDYAGKLKGSEVVISGTDLTNLMISAPVAAEVEEPEAEAEEPAADEEAEE